MIRRRTRGQIDDDFMSKDDLTDGNMAHGIGSGTIGRRKGFVLRFDPKPEPFPLVGSWMCIGLHVEVDGDRASSSWSKVKEIPLDVCVALADRSEVHHDEGRNFVEIEDDMELIVGRSGSTNIRMRVLKHSIHGFRLLVRSRTTGSQWNLEPAYSSEFTPVQMRLEVISQPVEAPRDTWYRDENVKVNPLTTKLRLLAAPGNEGRAIDLRVSAVLEDDMCKEIDGSIELAKHAASQLIIDPETEATIHTRLLKVSTSHERKCFRLKFAADTKKSPRNIDVGPAFSDLIFVRSKRNSKFKRKAVGSPILGGGDEFPVRAPSPVASRDINHSAMKNYAPVEPSGDPESSSLTRWAFEAFALLSNVQWETVAIEPVVVEGDVNVSISPPIMRCPSCFAYRDSIRNQPHIKSCQIARLLSIFERNLGDAPTVATQVTAAIPVEDRGSIKNVPSIPQNDQLPNLEPGRIPSENYSPLLSGVLPFDAQFDPETTTMLRQHSRTYSQMTLGMLGTTGVRDLFSRQFSTNSDGLLSRFNSSAMYGDTTTIPLLNASQDTEVVQSTQEYDNTESSAPSHAETGVSHIAVVETPYGMPALNDSNTIVGFYHVPSQGALVYQPKQGSGVDTAALERMHSFLSVLKEQDTSAILTAQSFGSISAIKKLAADSYRKNRTFIMS